MKKIYYCLIAICSFFIFSLSFNAYTFSYDFNQDMVNTMPNKWFGSNGWLSRISNVIDIYSDSIWISKDTIYIVRGLQQSNKFYYDIFLVYDDVTFNYSLKLSASKIYSISSENDLNVFIKNYKSNSSLEFVSSVDFSCSSLSSLIGSDFSAPKCDNFLVPFKKNRPYLNVYNRTSFDSFNFFGFKEYSSILGHSSSVDSLIGQLFLFSKFKFDKPSLDSSYHVYSLDSLFDVNNLDDSYVNYTLYSNEAPVLDKFVFYGKKYVDGLYYWVDLSYDYSKQELNLPYCAGDYDEPVYSNGIYSIKVFPHCFNVSDFSSVYMKVYFKRSVVISSYKFSGKNYYDAYLSDLCQDCIVDNILQSSDKILIFSSISSSYSFPFYYLKYTDHDSGEGTYSTVGLVDLFSFKFDSSNYLEYPSYYKSIYGDFYKSVGMSADLGKGFYGILMNAPNDTSVNIKYLYVPVDSNGNSIVYVSNNDLNSDKTSSSISFVDVDGNILHKEIFGNFDFNSSSDIGLIKRLFSSSLNSLDNIFNASIQLLHFVTDFFNSLSLEIQSFLLLLFCISMIVIFIKFIR